MNYSIFKVLSLSYLKSTKISKEATDGFYILRFLAFQRQKIKKSENILLKLEVDQSVLEKNAGIFLFFK